MIVNININYICRVKLTEHGAMVLKMNNPVFFKHNFDPETSILKTELWRIMQTFGPRMTMSGPQIFEGNTLSITDKI